MRKLTGSLLLTLLPLILAMLTASVLAQNTTRLIFAAHWDDGTAVQGTVALSQPVLGQPDNLLASRQLNLFGRASFSTALQANTVYDITLTLPDGTNVGPFLFTTVGLDLEHLSTVQDSVTFRLADNTISKQVVTLTMNF